MILGAEFYKMDERDRKALEQIGTVNMDQLPAVDKEAEREDDIKSAMEFLEDFFDPWEGAVKLNQWEEEFIDSIQNFLARGCRLTDKQFEKLLQIKVKYE